MIFRRHERGQGEVNEATGRWRVQVIRVGCLVAASLAAAYLWAVLFGDGLHGLKDSATLDRQPDSDLPNANIAFLAAVGVYIGSLFYALWSAEWRFGALTWCALTAATGLGVFAATRLFS